MIPYDSGISFTFKKKLNKQFSMENVIVEGELDL